MSRIAVLVGSVRRNGNTEMLANAFVKGAEESNEVTVISVADYNISACVGCNACADSENNDCCIDDDMQEIYRILAESEVIVVASPVYFYSISAQLKALVDRLHTPKRSSFKTKKLGLLLAAASPLEQVFDSIKIQYKLILDYFGLEDIGSVMVREVKDKGDIAKTDALQRAYELGKSIK